MLIPKPIKLINTDNLSSLTELINLYKDEGLEYIVVDDQKQRQEFIQDIYLEEDKFPYLEKIFDSNEHGYNYNVKLFSIDFEKYDEEYITP